MMRVTRISAVLLLSAGLSQTGRMIAQQNGAQPQQPAAAQGQPAPAQEPVRPDQPATFRAGINFVRVDVIVTDKKGEPVSDLAADDFQVLEDNKPQTIQQFKLIRVDGRQKPGDEPLRELKTSYDEELEAARDDVRLFVLFFDDYHTRDISAMVVKNPLTQFIQTQIGPKDLVAVMYPMTPLDDVKFSRNQASLLSAVQHFEGRKYKYEPRNLFEEQYAHYPTEEVERIRNQVVMTALRGLATHLGSLREGRKAIVYVGEGLGVMLPAGMRNANAQAPIPGAGRPDSPFEDSVAFFSYGDLMSDLQEVFGTANRNNAAIYTIDPRGLATSEFHIDDDASPAADRRILQQTQDVLRAMAEETDGRAIVNRNDLAKGLQQVVRDSSVYYLIGYNSSQAPTDGKFHEIKVKLADRVKSRGLQVRARKGYLAPTVEDAKRAVTPSKPDAPKPVQLALASMVQPGVTNQFVRSWIGMSRGENGKTRVTYLWEPVPPTAGAGGRREQPGRVSLLAASPAGDVIFRGKVPANAGPTGATGAPADPAGPVAGATAVGASSVPQQISFDAAPGKVELRISVEGGSGGVLDNDTRDVTVPNLSAAFLSMSTPRVYRARTVREVQALARDGAAVPMIGREFSRAERIIIRFDVYGAAEPTAALLNRAGTRVVDVPVTPAASGGTHQVEMALGTFAPGEYVIEITATKGSDEAKEFIPLRVGS